MADRWYDIRLHRLDPFRGLAEIQSEINRAFDSYFGSRPRVVPAAAERNWSPPADIYETRDDLVVSVELPGVKEKDVQLTIVGDILTLRGQRGSSAEAREENYHRIERWSGTFERHVELPVPVKADQVRATYKDGVLEIRLPKIEESKPREIKIEIG
jgi:HSP20 family protein